jgi:polyisoprenoid-binding protein YceI
MSFRSRPWFVLICALVLVPSVAWAAWTRTGSAAVAFYATGPVGLTIEGKTSALELTEDAGRVTLRVPLAKLDTGISLRNKHMREKYLEVQRFPAATLVVRAASLKLPAAGKSTTSTADGEVTIRDKTKTTPVKYTVTEVGGRYKVAGEFTINIKDYGIEVPSYLGVTVKPVVTVKARFEVTE